jgi:hypothetical protein
VAESGLPVLDLVGSQFARPAAVRRSTHALVRS